MGGFPDAFSVSILPEMHFISRGARVETLRRYFCKFIQTTSKPGNKNGVSFICAHRLGLITTADRLTEG